MLSQALEWLKLGGPAMLVLVLMSIAAMTLTIVKVWEFFEHRYGDERFVEPLLAAWRAGSAEAQIAALRTHPSPLAQLMIEAVDGLRRYGPSEALREQIAQQAADRLASARTLLRPLEVIGQLAPLVGLLGTVLGMIEAFQRLQAAGDRVDPAILSGGIWEALLTTAAGLIVAIPTIAVLNWLERRVERLHQAMESALTRLFARPQAELDAARKPGA